VIEQGFYQASEAFAQVRDRRLYRSTHKTFAAYCQDMFGFSRLKIDYLIAAAIVVENLQQTRTIHSQNQLNENSSTISANILPTNVEQTKALGSLKPNKQRQVWDKAVETAYGKAPTGQLVINFSTHLKRHTDILDGFVWVF